LLNAEEIANLDCLCSLGLSDFYIKSVKGLNFTIVAKVLLKISKVNRRGRNQTAIKEQKILIKDKLSKKQMETTKINLLNPIAVKSS
jgi:hypothetical protein